MTTVPPFRTILNTGTRYIENWLIGALTNSGRFPTERGAIALTGAPSVTSGLNGQRIICVPGFYVRLSPDKCAEIFEPVGTVTEFCLIPLSDTRVEITGVCIQPALQPFFSDVLKELGQRWPEAQHAVYERKRAEFDEVLDWGDKAVQVDPPEQEQSPADSPPTTVSEPAAKDRCADCGVAAGPGVLLGLNIDGRMRCEDCIRKAIDVGDLPPPSFSPRGQPLEEARREYVEWKQRRDAEKRQEEWLRRLVESLTPSGAAGTVNPASADALTAFANNIRQGGCESCKLYAAWVRQATPRNGTRLTWSDIWTAAHWSKAQFYRMKNAEESRGHRWPHPADARAMLDGPDSPIED